MKYALSFVLLAGLAFTAIGQDAKKVDAKKEEPTPVVVRAQLPRGWKALGLTDAQKKGILTTRAKYAAKRQAIQEQLKKLAAEEMQECEKLLTQAQKDRLKEVKK